MLRHARNVRGRPLQAASGAVDVIAGHRNNGSSSSADREQGAATPPPPPTLPVVSADGSFCGPASNAHATQVARRPRGAPAAQWRSFAAAPLTREVPGTSAWPTVHHHVPRQRHSGGRHLPGQHSGGGHLPGRHSGSGHLPERHSGSGQLPGHNAAAAADALQQQLLPDGDRRALEAMAFWSGGDEAALKALLLGRGSIKLFNAALKAVPDSQLPSLLELLPQQPGGAAAAAAATTFGSSGSSGDAVGAESSSSPGARTRGGGPAVLRPNVETAQILLERLPKGELRDELDHWMRVLLGAGLEPDYRVFLPWASYYAQAGSVSGVRSVMEEVEARGGRMAPQYYSQLVRAYCTRGRWKENEALLEEMRGRGIEPTEHIYRALIWCCGRHHRADRAQGVFDEMRARGLEPSVPTWSALLNAYADSRQPHRAVEALQGMRRQGLTPSVQVYGALAKAFAGSGDWRRALQVIERMEGDGVAPNEQVFGSVIEAAAVAGKPSVAAEVLRRMRAAGVQPNVIAYTSLLSSYGATGDVEGAEGVLREMAAAGCSPNQKSYTELMSQLADKGRHEECERYFRQMVADGCPTDGISYAILIDSMLTRWNRDREGQAALLPAVEARFAEAAAGPLGLHTYLHQPQGRMVLDLHGYSTWTAQLAVLATLDDLLHQHRKQGPITDHLSRLDIITGRGNRSVRRHRGKLRELVLEMLQHLLPVTFGRSNDGLLVLEGKALRKLFDAMTQQGRGFSLPEMAHCLVDPGTV